MKILIASLFVISGFAQASVNTCLDQIEAKAAKNGRIVRFIDAYSCNNGASCALTYEMDNSPYDNSINLGFSDPANKFTVAYTYIDGKNFRGWDLAGKRLCADVKNYLEARRSGSSLDVIYSKETARDALFCPFSKVYYQKRVKCSKI